MLLENEWIHKSKCREDLSHHPGQRVDIWGFTYHSPSGLHQPVSTDGQSGCSFSGLCSQVLTRVTMCERWGGIEPGCLGSSPAVSWLWLSCKHLPSPAPFIHLE